MHLFANARSHSVERNTLGVPHFCSSGVRVHTMRGTQTGARRLGQ